MHIGEMSSNRSRSPLSQSCESLSIKTSYLHISLPDGLMVNTPDILLPNFSFVISTRTIVDLALLKPLTPSSISILDCTGFSFVILISLSVHYLGQRTIVSL